MVGYWDRLTGFLGFPEIDLDNNAAERTLRPGVVGRKNDYGSLWSGELAAGMLSMLATQEILGINPRAWLTTYL